MSNQVVPFDQLTQMAKAMAGSGLFGVKTEQQALALMLDLVPLDDPFDAKHLLNLEADRVAVLEDQRHQRAERNAAPGLERDQLFSKRRALELVFVKVGEVGGSQQVHRCSSVEC